MKFQIKLENKEYNEHKSDHMEVLEYCDLHDYNNDDFTSWNEMYKRK